MKRIMIIALAMVFIAVVPFTVLERAQGRIMGR